MFFSDVLLSHSSSLGHGKWLLSIPVISSRGDRETGVWVNKWLLGLSESKRLLTVPVVSCSSDSKTSVWVDKWILGSSLSKLHLVSISLNNSKVLRLVLWSNRHE